MASAVENGYDRHIALRRRKVPVHITYFTLWVKTDRLRILPTSMVMTRGWRLPCLATTRALRIRKNPTRREKLRWHVAIELRGTRLQAMTSWAA